MKKKSSQFLLLAALAVAVVVVFSSGIGDGWDVLPQAVGGGGDFVWCSEWISIGCGVREEANKEAYLNTTEVNPTSYFTCGYDKGCIIESVTSLNFDSCSNWSIKRNNVYVGWFNQNSLAEANNMFRNMFIPHNGTLSIECTPLWLIASGVSHFNFRYTGKRLRLAYCTTGPTAGSCDASVSGVEILGADGCHYNVGDRPGASDPDVLDQQGNVIGSSAQSYLVPEGSNIWVPNPTRQYICGTTTDMCSVDSDCHYQHPFSWPLGSGLGNADITGTSLNVYGCTATGPEKCVSWSGTVEGSGECVQTERTKWCAITQSNVYTVECTPLTSVCGPNAFCDPDTFKCVATGVVVCDYERDPVCGTQVFCDRVTMALKEPYCRNPGTTNSSCEFRVLENVECCSTADCGPNYYCDSDHRCKVQAQACQECPWTCCEGPCVIPGNPYYPNVPAGKHCCPDHTHYWVSNISECDVWRCQSDADCLPDEKCVDGECVSNVVCEDRDPIPPWIVGWKTITTETPLFLIPLPWGGGLIEVGRTIEETCVEVWNWALIGLVVAALVFVLVLFWLYRRKPRRSSRKKKRRRK